MDADYDYYIGDKSTDDFYTYNSRDFNDSWDADVMSFPTDNLDDWDDLDEE